MWLRVAHFFQTFAGLQLKTCVKNKVPLIKCQFMPPHRTLVLTSCIKNEEKKVSPDKLDLDIWKTVMKETALETPNLCPSEDPVDSFSAATRELVQMWRLAGKAVPENLTEEQLTIVQELPSKSAKKKYLKYLAIKEGKKKATKEKQKIKQEQAKYQKEKENEGGIELRNTFLLQFWQRSFDVMYNWRAAQSMMFGQPLIFDMSYESYMARREMENTISQLLECEGFNRRSLDPFHLYFCNMIPEGSYHKEFLKRYGDAWDRLLITVTEKSYVDVFPKDKLVYLTADSPSVLKSFQHDKIYIIGSVVDKSIQTGLSLANAKRLKLATARLPLDEYLKWDVGAKNLTLNQMISILLTVKDTGNWQEALKFVPKRKHEGFLPIPEQKYCNQSKSYQNKTRIDKGPIKKTRRQKSTLSQGVERSSDRKRWWLEED
ncbi:tRNA methyltransferase 10 homolog C isoform X1 [Stegostoma tigrinum]|uniref:tRNA methyltransferase 10 homolog C isoform X1 n=2 Tax=Stegostoma tigrinum TaxID=3053191 RepID=UPI00202B8B42|nr:tRNA methyltransferase 10 homolog C isoform X1 [Stegostoma tigrinum]XP_059506012.1 tRNA methyltransferase 10 homolog C isoform X1 [Stegostoma tigrinum]